MRKPIRVFWSPLSERFYASQHYREEIKGGKKTGIVIITGTKYDVTQDIAAAIVKEEITFKPAHSGDVDNGEVENE